MRSTAPEIGRDPEHVRPVDTCGVRRSKIMRNQNMRLGHGKKCLRCFPLEVANYPLCHVLDIERTLSQVGIIDFIQRLGIPRGDFLENPLPIATISLQLPEYFVD